jgi:hypothetical protein
MSEITDLFENIKSRPLMYIGEYNVERLNCLLMGIHLGLVINKKINNYSTCRKHILVKRGWNSSSTLIHKDMEKQGLTETQIVQELLNIELETWKMLENTNSPK